MTVRAVQPGDVYLFCTDGLTEMAEDGEILLIVKNGRNIGDIVNRLVFTANENGGVDNITVVGMRIEEGGVQE